MRLKLATLIFASILISTGSACSATPKGLSPPKTVKTAANTSGALAKLTFQEAIPLSRDDTRKIAALDFWQSKARLADGRCVWLTKATSDPPNCEYVATAGRGIPSWACNSPAVRSTSGWFVECTVRPDGRSVITARQSAQERKSETLLAEVDFEVIRLGAITLHGRLMEIRSLGLNRAGEVIVSSHAWDVEQ